MDNETDDFFTATSKYQRTFIARYYGRTLVERWHTQPMLSWIVAEVKRLGNPRSETVFLTVTDTSIKAVNVKFGRTVFEHKIDSVIKFAQIADDQKCFAYLTKESSDISLCHVFQASDEDAILQLFSSLRETVQETAQQALFQPLNKVVGLTSNPSVDRGQSQHYEVLYVGKIKASAKRASPSFVDDATERFRTSGHDGDTLSLGSNPPISAQVIAERDDDSNKSLEEKENINHNSLPLTKTDQISPHPLKIDVELHKDNTSVPTTPSHPLNDSCQSSLLSPPVHSLISHTQSLDAAGRSALVKDIQAFSYDPDQFTSIIEDGSLRRQTSLPPMNAKNFIASSFGLARLSVDSSASTPEEKPEFNRTMLFLIGTSEFCLISTDRKQVFFSKPFADISHCSQGIKNSDHFGIICKEMTLTGMDVHIGYIFQCQSIRVVDEIMKTLKQAFHCSLQKEKSSSGKSFCFCPTCPLYWFHKLCFDVEGLTPEQVQTTIMLRIASLTQREQRDMMGKFQEMVVHNQAEQNVVFMMLLRALCEQKQMKHTHVFPKDTKPEQTKSRTGLDNLKSIAKKTFPSPFESIFRHAASDAQYSEKPKEMTLIKTHSLPISVVRSSSKSSLNIIEKRKSPSPQHVKQNSMPDSPRKKQNASEVNNLQSASGKEASPKPSATISNGTFLPKSEPSSSHPNERSLSDTAAIIWELQQDEQKKHSGNVSLFTSSDFKINELPRIPLKSSMSPLRNIFLKVGTQNRTSPLKEIKEQQGGNYSVSWRKILFNRVQTPVQQNLSIVGEGSKCGKRSGDQVKRSSGSLKALWKKAIMEQMILIRMEKENKKLQLKQDRTFQKRIKLEYEEICPCPDDALQKWEAAMSSPLLQFKNYQDMIQYGVPRQKRGEIWCYLAEQYFLQNKPLPLDDTPYTDFLQKLTPYQHSILIDLGRTYPGQKYFSQALGPGQLSLFSNLKAYSLMDEEVGYCQGLSFLAGALLLHMAEEKAFQMMKHIMFTLGFRNQYKPDMCALQIQMYQLARLIHDTVPDIDHHFDSLDISPGLYAAPWFLTLFASHFPIGFVARLVDMVFLQGLEAVFKVAVLLLRTHSAQILNCNSFESVMEFLKTTLPSSGHFGMEKVLEQVLSFDVGKQLQAYQVEYMVLKEEMSQEYMTQVEPKKAKTLESENKELQKVNMELTEQLQVAQNSVRTLEASVTSYQSTVRQLETRVRSLQDERDALHHSVNILRKRLENLENSTPPHEEVISDGKTEPCEVTVSAAAVTEESKIATSDILVP